jgi:hypothetical protein
LWEIGLEFCGKRGMNRYTQLSIATVTLDANPHQIPPPHPPNIHRQILFSFSSSPSALSRFCGFHVSRMQILPHRRPPSESHEFQVALALAGIVRIAFVYTATLDFAINIRDKIKKSSRRLILASVCSASDCVRRIVAVLDK